MSLKQELMEAMASSVKVTGDSVSSCLELDDSSSYRQGFYAGQHCGVLMIQDIILTVLQKDD